MISFDIKEESVVSNAGLLSLPLLRYFVLFNVGFVFSTYFVHIFTFSFLFSFFVFVCIVVYFCPVVSLHVFYCHLCSLDFNGSDLQSRNLLALYTVFLHSGMICNRWRRVCTPHTTMVVAYQSVNLIKRIFLKFL